MKKTITLFALLTMTTMANTTTKVESFENFPLGIYEGTTSYSYLVHGSNAKEDPQLVTVTDDTCRVKIQEQQSRKPELVGATTEIYYSDSNIDSKKVAWIEDWRKKHELKSYLNAVNHSDYVTFVSNSFWNGAQTSDLEFQGGQLESLYINRSDRFGKLQHDIGNGDLIETNRGRRTIFGCNNLKLIQSLKK